MKFASKVIHGCKHGRAIGYPTANLEINPELESALPKEGVYAVRVKFGGKEYGGALFYGERTLFKEDKVVCEILLLDFTGDLYGKVIEIEVWQFLRLAAVVKDEAELKELIEEDIKKVGNLYKNNQIL